MKKNKALTQEKEFMTSLEDIVASYEEIAAMKTRQVKKSVLYNRKFLEGLNEAYAYVSFSASRYLKELNKVSFSRGRGKQETVRVLLATNTGLFGELVRNTFDIFAKDAVKDKLDNKSTSLVVVGKMGINLMKIYLTDFDYSYFDLSDMVEDEANTGKIFTHLSDYSDIVVYHGIFKSILSQDAISTYLLGEVNRLKGEISNVRGSFNFIFEPSIDEVNNYFEKQIRMLLFEQTLNESSLSKYASRMVSLSEAQDRIVLRKQRVDALLRKSDHKRKNASLFSNYLRNVLWNS